MSGMQAWVFLLALAILALRGVDRLRMLPGDLWVVGLATAVALVQRLALGQVTLDDPFFAPILLGLPLVAAIRGGPRDGVVGAFGTWMAVALMALILPTRVAGDLVQEELILAFVLAALSAGAAGVIARSSGVLAPLMGALWIAFFAVRDGHLVKSPALWGVVLLGIFWTHLGVIVVGPREAVEG